MHWNGCGVGGPTVQHQACGASICKAGMGWVGQRDSSSRCRGKDPGLIWSLSAILRSSPFPVCRFLLVRDPFAGGKLLRPLSLFPSKSHLPLYSFLLSSQPLFSLGFMSYGLLEIRGHIAPVPSKADP